MVVRIRYSRPRPLATFEWRQIAITVAALLTPCALLAFTMAFWIFASQMQWTGEFFISKGLLSRWEIWVATAAVLLVVARVLDRLSQAYPAGLGSRSQYPHK
jgi:hypothetical protein